MQFTIGTRVYHVRRKWDLSCDGEKCEGLCDYSRRLLWLDGELLEDTIIDTLRHEHVHAWEAEVGATRTTEDRANFISTVSAAFDAEFANQGGLDALLAVPIEGLRPSKQNAPPLRSLTICDRIECGRCFTPVMAGSIYTSEPHISGSTGVRMVHRGMQCPVCDTVQVWQERCSEDGIPLGEFYHARILTGAEAAEWVVAHPVHAPYNVT